MTERKNILDKTESCYVRLAVARLLLESTLRVKNYAKIIIIQFFLNRFVGI